MNRWLKNRRKLTLRQLREHDQAYNDYYKNKERGRNCENLTDKSNW